MAVNNIDCCCLPVDNNEAEILENDVAIWKISKHDSDNEGIFIGDLPGNMSETEISEVLKRLVCRQLSEEEILLSSLRQGAKLRRPLLDAIGSGAAQHFGENPYFLASLEK
jgi:hypothetical protein